jgi:hypothetical protein
VVEADLAAEEPGAGEADRAAGECSWPLFTSDGTWKPSTTASTSTTTTSVTRI